MSAIKLVICKTGVVTLVLVGLAVTAQAAPEITSASDTSAPPMGAKATTHRGENTLHLTGPKSPANGDAVLDMGKVEKVTDRYPNGKIKVEREVGQDAKGNYINQGSYAMYDLDGQIVKSGEFVSGKQQGKWTQRLAKDEGNLFSSGQDNESPGPFVSEATFIDGQLHGIWTIKDSNGQNIVEWSFDNGTRNGTWIWWHSNGKKRLEATYKNGTLNGDVQEWDREEKLLSRNTFVDGKCLVRVVGWHALGQKHYEGCYLRAQNLPEATYDWWNSKVTTVAAPKGGADQQQGVWTSWYPNGNKETEAQYDHGARIGKFKWWYDNGQNQAEGEYEAGQRNGVWITWHPNGLKETMGEYKDGQLVSKWSHWDVDGKLVESSEGEAPRMQTHYERGGVAQKSDSAASTR
jgi:antitoxin component YwqK of YwqJK toxin-antitoxin module